MERLDSVWNALAFDAPWKSAQEKEHARVALERFLKWHVDSNGVRAGRVPVASEHDFDVTLEAGDYEVRIRGSMDHVETDTEGRAYVVDFKTGKHAPSAAEVAHHPQLAVYQLAVREGAVDDTFDGVHRAGRRGTRPAASGRRQERRRDPAQGAGPGAPRRRVGRRPAVATADQEGPRRTVLTDHGTTLHALLAGHGEMLRPRDATWSSRGPEGRHVSE